MRKPTLGADARSVFSAEAVLALVRERRALGTIARLGARSVTLGAAVDGHLATPLRFV
jgi:hypothetical protein